MDGHARALPRRACSARISRTSFADGSTPNRPCRTAVTASTDILRAPLTDTPLWRAPDARWPRFAVGIDLKDDVLPARLLALDGVAATQGTAPYARARHTAALSVALRRDGAAGIAVR